MIPLATIKYMLEKLELIHSPKIPKWIYETPQRDATNFKIQSALLY